MRTNGANREATGSRGPARVLLILAALAFASAAASGAGGGAKPPDAAATPAPRAEGATAGGDPSRVIEIHVGIPGMVYLGQPVNDLRARFPKATVTPFANQNDAAVVTAPDAGISCYVVGPTPDDLKVASVGFVLEGTYMGAIEGGFRTREGIGKGSTVNDLLEKYGKPAEITGERATTPALRLQGQKEDPNAPQKYHYLSPDQKVKTYFVVQGSRVLRVVINDLEPLGRHILKRSPEK